MMRQCGNSGEVTVLWLGTIGKRIIITGATGYVGEGVLLECFAHPAVEEVLVVGRKACGRQHAELKELLVKDCFTLNIVADRLHGYDVCFFCAGISSIGMKEPGYTAFTHDATIAFAKAVHAASPAAAFTYVSGAGTEGTEKGRSMWARVKGRTENDLGGSASRRTTTSGAFTPRTSHFYPTPAPARYHAP
ncbi:MAG: epimerase [Flavobacteriales bacterium]|nr:epimerase [Flavobacteriales bacterium]